MVARRPTAAIVRVDLTTHAGDTRPLNYGPFLPHVGGATATFIERLEHELEASAKYQSWSTSIEDVYIGDQESDCEVRAIR